ncbi:MAG TPA: hypothetical protein DD435_08920 [Cyanobacteria bacterium UBA8530]|nr:hypothetical protein [Cyanobacteria bacterium UBA8530]
MSPSFLKQARLGVMAAFFVNGAVLASWFPHIPGVSRSLALSLTILDDRRLRFRRLPDCRRD